MKTFLSTVVVFAFLCFGAVPARAMTSGTTTTGSITAGNFSTQTFTASAGQSVLLFAKAAYTVVMKVYEPDGTHWIDGDDRLNATLPVSGTYTVKIYGYYYTDSGPFSVDYLQGGGGVSDGSLTSGQTYNGTLAANGIESFQFTGTAGQSFLLFANAHDPAYATGIFMYKPDGSYYTSASDRLYTSLPVTGTYTVAVVSYYNDSNTNGPYALSYLIGGGGVSDGTLTSGQTYNGTLAANGIDSFQFTGAAGQSFLLFTNAHDPAYPIAIYVYKPDGSYYTSTSDRLHTSLPVTGTYTVAVLSYYNYSNTNGPYALSYLIGGGTVSEGTLVSTETRPGTLTANGINSYRFSGVASNSLTLSITSPFSYYFMVYCPDGSLCGDGHVPSPLTVSGTYTLAFFGYNSASYGSYTATLTTTPQTVAATDATKVGQFCTPCGGEINPATTVGDPINFDVGYLTESASDYAAGGLSFSRAYRSDSTWTDNTIGQLWRTNYARSLTVTSTTASITDGTGATTHYTKSGSNWVPDSADTTATLTDDGSGGYVYRLPSNTVERYNSSKQLARIEYLGGGALTLAYTATSATRVTTYTYFANTTDANGNVVLGRLKQVDGPRTDVTDTVDFTYDTNLDLKTVTNALSQVTTIVTRDSAGRPTEVTDANGVETDYAYDTNGRLHTTTRAAGTSLAAVTTFDYDANGNLTKITLPNSAYLNYSYDTAQRLTGIEDALGNTITYTLDDAGNITKEGIKDSSSTLKYTHQKAFDALSRIIQSIGAASQTANYAYDANGNLTTYTDPKTNATAYAYDAIERLITKTDALSGVATNGYDTRDNLTSAQDQRSNTTSYTYNGFGDVTTAASPDSGTVSFTTDKAGNVTQRTDARGIVTNYTYDALNRLKSVSYPSDTSLNATLTYDSTTGCGTAPKGHLCGVTDAAGTTAYQYDALGRVTQQKDTHGTINLTTSYTYDLAGNITGITLPSGRTITYTRNANGQTSGVSADVNSTATTLASSITYLPFGPMTGLTYGNSLTFSATYDQDYNPTNRTVSSIYNNTYTTDNNGNVTQAGTTTYGYDALNRINAENGTATTYTYDATSNRLTKVQGTTTTTTVPTTSNKISAVGSDNYTYDDSGNITNDGTNTYTWNAPGQLATVNTNAGVYTYNWLNQRTKKVTTAATTYYVYGAGGKLYGEYDSSGNLIREYIYLNGQPLAQVDAGTPETLTYLHTDHQGTPRYATNQSGTQVWSWTNDAFGTFTPSGTATINLRMPGQYFDSESGLFYNHSRYYNPAIGRYISSDPIGIAGGLNTFGYVGQNPVNNVDPWGLAGSEEDERDILENADIMAEARSATFYSYARQLREIDPNNPALSYVTPPDWVPSSENIESMRDALEAAQQNEAGTCPESLSPDFIVSAGGTVYPLPKGATGPIDTISSGGQWTGGSGGWGFDLRTNGFRFMDPTTSGRYPYPQGRGTYMNSEGQAVDPFTGQTISTSDANYHISGGQ